VGVGAGGLGFTGGSFGGTGAGLSASLIFSAISPVSALGASSSAAVFVSSGFRPAAAFRRLGRRGLGRWRRRRLGRLGGGGVGRLLGDRRRLVVLGGSGTL
jgi:Uncharacterized conserved protein (DUF2048).